MTATFSLNKTSLAVGGIILVMTFIVWSGSSDHAQTLNSVMEAKTAPAAGGAGNQPNNNNNYKNNRPALEQILSPVLDFSTSDGDKTAVNKDKDDIVVNKNRFIFVDLGAGDGHTTDSFFMGSSAPKPIVFGKIVGLPNWCKLEAAEVFLFEANSVFNRALVQNKQRWIEKGHENVHIFPMTAVSTRNGLQTFFTDTQTPTTMADDAKQQEEETEKTEEEGKSDEEQQGQQQQDQGLEGRSLATDEALAGHSWGSLNDPSILDPSTSVVRHHATRTQVESINLSTWLLQNFLPRDTVILYMDVEGTEYDLIPHLIETGAYSVVDFIMVHWKRAALDPSVKSEKVSANVEALAWLKEHGVQYV